MPGKRKTLNTNQLWKKGSSSSTQEEGKNLNRFPLNSIVLHNTQPICDDALII